MHVAYLSITDTPTNTPICATIFILFVRQLLFTEIAQHVGTFTCATWMTITITSDTCGHRAWRPLVCAHVDVVAPLCKHLRGTVVERHVDAFRLDVLVMYTGFDLEDSKRI